MQDNRHGAAGPLGLKMLKLKTKIMQCRKIVMAALGFGSAKATAKGSFLEPSTVQPAALPSAVLPKRQGALPTHELA